MAVISEMTFGEYSLLAVTSIFVIMDPIAVVPAFIAMTQNNPPPAKLRMARLACWVAAGILMLFAAAGNLIFKVLGITLPAFQLAGSILLLRIAMDMLYARRSPAQETDAEVAAGAAKDDIAITPLGVPMLAGPGAISTVLILLNQAQGISQVSVLFASIGLVCFVSYWVFWLAVRGSHHLNPWRSSCSLGCLGCSWPRWRCNSCSTRWSKRLSSKNEFFGSLLSVAVGRRHFNCLKLQHAFKCAVCYQ